MVKRDSEKMIILDNSQPSSEQEKAQRLIMMNVIM